MPRCGDSVSSLFQFLSELNEIKSFGPILNDCTKFSTNLKARKISKIAYQFSNQKPPDGPKEGKEQKHSLQSYEGVVVLMA